MKKNASGDMMEFNLIFNRNEILIYGTVLDEWWRQYAE